MKRILCAAALLVAAAQFAAGQTPDKPAQTAGEKVGMGDAEQSVNGRVRDFLAALRKGDAEALASLYADDYTITNDTGDVQTKAQRLEWVKANTARLSTLDFQDLKTRVYGDTAVVTGHATSKSDAINSRIIQVWVKQGGTWRLVAGQTTIIAPAQPATPPAEKKP